MQLLAWVRGILLTFPHQGKLKHTPLPPNAIISIIKHLLCRGHPWEQENPNGYVL